MLRGDFHHHIDADPVDGRFVCYSIGALIDHAATLGLQVLAVTCHESVPYDGAAVRYAADKGILLLRGMEATVARQHVLLLNFRDFPPGICTMDEIAARKDPGALVIAPHPFYPTAVASGELLRAYPSVFDAVEFSGMYTQLTPHFNRQAEAFARSAGLPVVGNTDTHFLWQAGRTFTWIDAPADKDAVLDAIRHGRVQVSSRPLSWHQVVRFIHGAHATTGTVRDGLQYMRKILRRTRAAEQVFEARPASDKA